MNVGSSFIKEFFHFLKNNILFVKSTSRQCPNGHETMLCAHIKTTKKGKQAWSAIPW
jgi:hypothetical protein